MGHISLYSVLFFPRNDYYILSARQVRKQTGRTGSAYFAWSALYFAFYHSQFGFNFFNK